MLRPCLGPLACQAGRTEKEVVKWAAVPVCFPRATEHAPNIGRVETEQPRPRFTSSMSGTWKRKQDRKPENGTAPTFVRQCFRGKSGLSRFLGFHRATSRLYPVSHCLTSVAVQPRLCNLFPDHCVRVISVQPFFEGSAPLGYDWRRSLD